MYLMHISITYMMIAIRVSKHGIEIFAEENSLQMPLFALERKYLIRRIILTFPYAFIVDIYEGYVYVHLR